MGANRPRRPAAATQRWLRRASRSPFPVYAVEGWTGRRFVVDQDHAGGRLAQVTVAFADAEPTSGIDVRVTTTRRPPSRSGERMARHLDPWLAAVVGEARGYRRIDLVADPEAVVQLTSTWQGLTVPVDGESMAFRARCEDDAWVAYAHHSDHAVIVCAERAAALPPPRLRLATVRASAAVEGDGLLRRPRRRG